jgi:hypothetical protein
MFSAKVVNPRKIQIQTEHYRTSEAGAGSMTERRKSITASILTVSPKPRPIISEIVMYAVRISTPRTSVKCWRTTQRLKSAKVRSRRRLPPLLKERYGVRRSERIAQNFKCPTTFSAYVCQKSMVQCAGLAGGSIGDHCHG